MSDEEDDNDDALEGDDGADEGGSEATEDVIETRSSEAHRRLRDQMESEIEAFLRSGGKIEQVASGANNRGGPLTAGVNDLP